MPFIKIRSIFLLHKELLLYQFTKNQLVQLAIMDTFDALSPTFDKPATMKELKRLFEGCGYQDFEVWEGGTGLVGNGVKSGK